LQADGPPARIAASAKIFYGPVFPECRTVRIVPNDCGKFSGAARVREPTMQIAPWRTRRSGRIRDGVERRLFLPVGGRLCADSGRFMGLGSNIDVPGVNQAGAIVEFGRPATGQTRCIRSIGGSIVDCDNGVPVIDHLSALIALVVAL
jgi:hypothetical protein